MLFIGGFTIAFALSTIVIKVPPQFHEQLSNFLRRNLHEDIFPGLQSESLAWFVEYLKSVRPKITLLHAILNIYVGSCRCLRSRRARFQGILE